MRRLLRATVFVAATALLALPQAATASADAPHVEPAEPVAQPAPQHPIKSDDAVAAPDQARRAQASATATGNATAAPFLTRPYLHHHDVTSVFDHCNPTYSIDNYVCEEDGTTGIRSYGTAPDFSSGYATSPGGSSYLYYDGHDGWDIALNYETLLAAADGTVYFAGWSSYGFGLTVIIDHPNGLSTRYGHMSRIDVQQGQQVYRGQQIGISGNTGNSTGAHLHFGVYRNDPWTAIDPWGWEASWADPWPYQLGDLWISGNPVDPVPTAPANVTASAVGGYATVSWTQPTFDGASPITGFKVTASPGGATVTAGGGSSSATIGPLAIGTTYTFTVTASNQVGQGDTSAPSPGVTMAPPAFASWFNWYDNVSPGMTSDYIHLVNPSSSATATGYVVFGSDVRAFSIQPGAETIVGYPPGTIGGPIHVLGSATVLGSQRVEYNQSFNEVTALPDARAGTDLYLDWYDLASVGMQADNIHIVNPAGSTTHVDVSGPGPALSADVPAGGETYLSWPTGTIGGPVHVRAAAPVFASQRVEYDGTFNEVAARASNEAATTLVFNWYDRASPGMWNDNIHVVNPSSTATAAVTVRVGTAQQQLSVGPGGTAYATFPAGTIGGPVTVSATSPVLASQRVQYYTSFNEVLGVPVTSASTSLWMPWYDDATAGMLNDNVHLVNPSSSASAHVTVTGPGTTRVVDLAPGAEAWVNWPGSIGGPIHVVSTGTGVIASQRVQFYSSFNEAVALSG